MLGTLEELGRRLALEPLRARVGHRRRQGGGPARAPALVRRAAALRQAHRRDARARAGRRARRAARGAGRAGGRSGGGAHRAGGRHHRAGRGVRHGAHLRLDRVHQPEHRRAFHAPADGRPGRRAIAQGTAALRGGTGDRRAARALRPQGRRDPAEHHAEAAAERDERQRSDRRTEGAVPASRTSRAKCWPRNCARTARRSPRWWPTAPCRRPAATARERPGHLQDAARAADRRGDVHQRLVGAALRHRARRGAGGRSAADDRRRVDRPGDGGSRAAARHPRRRSCRRSTPCPALVQALVDHFTPAAGRRAGASDA